MKGLWPLMFGVFGCQAQQIQIAAPDTLKPAIEDFVGFMEDDRFVVTEGTGACAGASIVLVDDLDCTDCYEITGGDGCFEVHGDRLGVQYGLAALLESAGIRFYHPDRTYIPETVVLPDTVPGERQEPQMRRRGLHLHTLHPIEGYFAMWEPRMGTEPGRRIADWVIKNRGNHVQWVALDGQPTGWDAHTAALIDAMHQRGLTVGLGVQLYGFSNLQKAFDLVDKTNEDKRAQMERQWAKVTGLDFDLFNLSFGEFFSTDPETFIADINLAYAVMKEQAPSAEMTTVLHVGDDLRVDYNGENWIYYNLAQFADPEITPWVHTVMYYNLYDDAGGAYHHDTFGEHRAILEDRLEQSEPVGYFPESAYWVAFDVSVPQYNPVYIRSRWTDMNQLPTLDDHVLFSSGWEWGYWQNDVATLRMNWKTPDTYRAVLEEMFAPFAASGVVDVLEAVTEAQHDTLINERLAPWLAGQDSAMEAGAGAGVIAQPLRTPFDALSESERDLIAQLDSLAIVYQSQLSQLDVGDNPWLQEIEDGLWVNAQRAAFMSALIRAVIDEDVTALRDAEAAYDAAAQRVTRRHERMWTKAPETMVTYGFNNTLYEFGYLTRADELCYWERERRQVLEVLGQESLPIPGCLLDRIVQE